MSDTASDAADITFTVITPVFNTDPEMLRECIASVMRQRHTAWSLCLVDDGSTRQDTRDAADPSGYSDERISRHSRPHHGGMVEAGNDGLAMAEGDYVAFLDHGDVLAPEALSRVASHLHDHPNTDVVYSDEDKFDRPGHHFDVFRKPGWSPETIMSQMYVGGLTVYRRTIVERVGGFRAALDGSQDWDLLLRVTEQTAGIRHIPEVLYHRRSLARSATRESTERPYAVRTAKRALEDALERRNQPGHADYLPAVNGFQVRHRIDPAPLVSVVIPTAATSRSVRGDESSPLIYRALDSLFANNDYPAVEVTIVLSAGMDRFTEAALRQRCLGLPVGFVHSPDPFTFTGAINRGALEAQGELLLLLNDDIEAMRRDWMRLLVEQFEVPQVGVAGSRLLREDGTVQHAGVQHLRNGAPFHLQAGQPDDPGYFGEVALTRNYLAVTGAVLMTRTSLFRELGALSPIFPMNYSDIDYCLKARVAGFRTVYAGQSVLHHYENSSRDPGVLTREIATWQRYWADITMNDPYVPASRLPVHS